MIKKKFKICFVVFITSLFTVFFASKIKNLFALKNYKKMFTIVFTTDDNYILPTSVAMNTLMKTGQKSSFYEITILAPENLDENNVEKLKNVEKNYKNCSVDLISINDKYKNVPCNDWTDAIYYRLEIPKILNNKEVCLYLDGDILVKEDVGKMFDFDMTDYYIAGVEDGVFNEDSDYNKILNIDKTDTYINSGVLLMNLKKMREDDIYQKFMEKVYENSIEKKFIFPDQCIINSVCYGKIRILPLKYNFLVDTLKPPYDKIPPKIRDNFTKEIWEKGIENPTIIHYIGPKPWNEETYLVEEWWKEAKETEYFEEICEKYPKVLEKLTTAKSGFDD